MSYLAIKIGAWFIAGLSAFTLLWDASETPAPKLQPGVQITTTLNSVVQVTVAPTTTDPKGCAQYVADAISAGWPADQAPMLARVMFRESRCNALAFNSQDPGGSRGLMQVNAVHETWLKEAGIITHLDDLFYADVNIRAALHLWRMVGWSAWAATYG
jgi:hypothetical protein